MRGWEVIIYKKIFFIQFTRGNSTNDKYRYMISKSFCESFLENLLMDSKDSKKVSISTVFLSSETNSRVRIYKGKRVGLWSLNN